MLPLHSPLVPDLTKSVPAAASHAAPETWGFNADLTLAPEEV